MQSTNNIIQTKKTTTITTTYKNKKQRDKQAATENNKLTTIDPTDTIAVLSPYFIEINLWPASTTGYINSNGRGSSTGTSNITDMNTINTTGTTSSTAAIATSVDINSIDNMNRTTFIKEGNKVPLLRHIENAVCDMR